MNYAEKLKSCPIHWALGGADTSGGLEQNAIELAAFCEWLEKNEVKTILEIGMAKGYLKKFLTECGYQVDGLNPHPVDGVTFLGNSQDERIIRQVGSYDLIFVDGDHNQVDADFFAYKNKCRFLAFHDICGLRDCQAVAQLWDKVKGTFIHWEFIDSEHPRDSAGIGVLDLSQGIVKVSEFGTAVKTEINVDYTPENIQQPKSKRKYTKKSKS